MPPAFLPAPLPFARLRARPATSRRALVAAAAPRPARAAPRASPSPSPSPCAHVAPPPLIAYEDGWYARACIWVLRTALRSRTGLRSPRAGYSGLADDCHLLQARATAREQQDIVDSLLRAAVFAPIGVAMFRTFFANRPAFNADLTPRAFAWLVGDADRNSPEEGGEGVLVKQCRFLDEARCKGQQPVQKLFTEVLGLPLRMTPNYDDHSCQFAFGVAPLPIDEDPAMSQSCLMDCKSNMAFKMNHMGAKCYVQADKPPPPPPAASVAAAKQNAAAP